MYSVWCARARALTRAASAGSSPPADTTCPHASFWIAQQTKSRQQGVALMVQRQACDVVGVCLATDLFSVHAWGGERPSVPICLLWLHQFCPPRLRRLTADVLRVHVSALLRVREKGENDRRCQLQHRTGARACSPRSSPEVVSFLSRSRCEEEILLSHADTTAKDRNICPPPF